MLAADPPSLPEGESITAMVTSSKPFFKADTAVSITGEGGLVLVSLIRQDDRHAIATISAVGGATVGAHRFIVSIKDETATLDVSVIAEADGPGTASSDNATATAGAYMATLTINGQGTHFDSMCEVEVEGADGFDVHSVNVQTEGWLDVSYSIDIEQEPTQATVVVIDGQFSYEIPFTILSPAEFDTTVTGQMLTKGRVGDIVLSHPEASLHSGTRFQTDGLDIDAGDADVTDPTEVSIPVRVPFTSIDSSLVLQAHTYSEGGAILEIIDVTISLLEPAYLATVPSRLTNTAGVQTVNLVAAGVDLTLLTDLTLESDPHVSLASWLATSASAGTADITLDSAASSGGYALTADDGIREIYGTVAVMGSGKNAFESESDVYAGDHLYISFVVYGGDLVDGDIELTGDDDITAVAFTFVDPGCVIAELEIDDNATDGLSSMTLSSNGEDYNVYLVIENSGL